MSQDQNSPDGHRIAQSSWVDLLGSAAAIVVLVTLWALWWAITPC